MLSKLHTTTKRVQYKNLKERERKIQSLGKQKKAARVGTFL